MTAPRATRSAPGARSIRATGSAHAARSLRATRSIRAARSAHGPPNLRRRSATGRRAQGGYTLIEVVLAVGIASLIILPLMAWAGLVLREQPETGRDLVATAGASLLTTHFSRDVPVAGRAAVAGEGLGSGWATDCGAGPGAGGSVQVVLVTGGSSVRRVVYTVADSTDGGGAKSIWRRTCSAGDPGVEVTDRELFSGVALGATRATCIAGGQGDPCRQIEFVATPDTDRRPLVLRSSRRVADSSVPTDVTGAPRPVARIQLLSRSGTQPTVARLSAARSSVDPSRTIEAYDWDGGGGAVVPVAGRPDQVDVTFPTEGDYTVALTITDDLGATDTTYLQISTSNAPPVAVIGSVAPAPATAGSPVTLDATGSYDPDGALADIVWRVTPPGDADVITLSGASAVFTPADGVVGNYAIALEVTDAQLARGDAFATVEVVDPDVPPPDPDDPGGDPDDPGGPGGPGDPGDPGTVVASFEDAGAPGAARTFTSTSTGVGPDATFQWSFGYGAAGATGPSVAHEFPNPGEYPVTLIVTAADGTTASTLRTVAVAGTPPAPNGVRVEGGVLRWDPVPGAARYRVDFEFRTARDCFVEIFDQVVGPSASPSKDIPPNPCRAETTARARVGVEANGALAYSGWISFPPDAGGTGG